MLKQVVVGLVWAGVTAVGGQGLDASLAVGTWYGRALPDDAATAPFAEVVMMPTFLPDGTLIANDAIEWLAPHGTAHGVWQPTPQGARGVFVWFNLSAEAVDAGNTKVLIDGVIDPARPDVMVGTVTAWVFPPGTDPLDPSQRGAVPLGSFTIEGLRRLKPESGGAAAATSLSVGTWYGRALPDDAATAPFAEVVMMPTFLADGTVIANDAIEWFAPHGTAHGAWAATAQGNSGEFYWFNVSAEAPFAGTTKVRFTGVVDPETPDVMTGTVAPVVFPPGPDPLDAADTGGAPLGGFTIEGLRRVTIASSASPPPGDGRPTAGSPFVGTWYGRALPDDAATAPFSEVVMMATFLADGTLIANDAVEWFAPHSTARGAWVPTASGVEGVFLWFNLSPDEGFVGTVKVRLSGVLDAAGNMVGTVAPVFFPPGTDPLDAADMGGVPLGTFTMQPMRRLRLAELLPTAVEAVHSETAPTAYRLDDPYPNPFNPQTTLRFWVPFAAPVRLDVFNAGGQLVRRLFDGRVQRGGFSLVWDGMDAQGRPVGSGVYHYRMVAPGRTLVKKGTLVR